MQIKYAVFVAIFIAAAYNMAISSGELIKQSLKIKNVIVSKEVVNDNSYIDGEENYPEFKTLFKSKRYYIRKEADIVFAPEDIKSIKVNSIPTFAENSSTFGITIQLVDNASKRAAAYSNEKIGKLMAICIDDHVIAIPIAFETIGKEAIFILEMPLKDIEKQFLKISTNILIEPSKVPDIWNK